MFRIFLFWQHAEGILRRVKKDESWPRQIPSISTANDELRAFFTKSTTSILGEDEEQIKLCIPQYPPVGKRMLIENGSWSRALKREKVHFSKCEMRCILGCLKLLLETGHAALDCKQSVHDIYNQWVDEGNLQRPWGAPHMKSWSKNSKGRMTQNWPYTLLEFWNQTQAPKRSDNNLFFHDCEQTLK